MKYAAELLSEPELVDDSTIAGDVLLLEVREKISSVTDHLQEPAAAVVILRVVLEVLVEGVDAAGEDCDLYLGRAGVVLTELVFCDNLLLEFFLNHGFSPFNINIILSRKARQSVGEIRKLCLRYSYSNIISQIFAFVNTFS